ncbi:hypothetical protein QBC44DRAFT_63455 [Cladorrhinum sp. PSN332]|nr:hypothetical protein QBC44DRAFT_63455 [Cladorrhinum sp. PSN332]
MANIMAANEATPPPFTKLECYLYQDSSKPYFESGNIDQENIAGWLGDKSTPSPSKDGKPLVAALRLVLAYQRMVNVHPFGDPVAKEVHHVLELPECYSRSAREVLIGCGRYTVSATKSVLVSFANSSIYSPLCTLSVINYDSTSKIAVGYVSWFPSFTHVEVIKSIQEQFSSSDSQALPELLVPITLADMTVHKLFPLINALDIALRLIEEATGFSFRDLEHSADMNQAFDFTRLIKELGDISGRITLITADLHILLSRIEFILDEVKSQDIGVNINRSKMVMMEQRVKLLKRVVQDLLIEVSRNQNRLQTQQTILFNMITQEDSKANLSVAADSKQLAADSKQLALDSMEVAADSRELAAASKRDSSAMKIIAYMTTLFLPATFLSSLFSMPLFNWEAPSVSDIASSHLWLYWAVAIPLTLVVMATFGVYAWYQRRKNRLHAQIAREAKNDKVKDV